MSGYTDDKLQIISSDSDVALLQKPFRIHDLLHKLQQVFPYPDAARALST